MNIFSEEKSILSNSQYGFRGKRNTEMALLAQNELVANSFERKLYSLEILIVFTKAFDQLNRRILIRKLEGCEILGVAPRLIKSYLEHRK